MALTQEQIDNAGLDTITLGEVVNGPAGLNGTGKAITRTGAQIKTLAKLEEEGEARITALQASSLQAELAADRAAMSAAIAEALFAAPYDTVPAGEAGTAEGEHFAVDNGDGTVTVYERTAGGSSARWSLATTAALASPDAGKGAALVAKNKLDANEVDQFVSDYIADRKIVTAEAFGATGDGTTNDTTTLQLAVTRAAVSGLVLELNGIYLVDTIDVPDNTIIRGKGTVKKRTDSDTPTLDLTGSDNVWIEGITVDGNSSIQTSTTARSARAGEVTINAVGDGNTSTGIVIHGVTVQNCHGRGIAGTGLIDSRITDSIVQDTGGRGIAIASNCQNVDVRNNTVRRTYLSGIWHNGQGTMSVPVGTSSRIRIIGNDIEDTYHDPDVPDSGLGIEFIGSAEGIISLNSVKNAASMCLSTGFLSHVTVLGNDLDGAAYSASPHVQGFGIESSFVSSSQYVANRVRNCRVGVFITSGSGNLYTANTIEFDVEVTFPGDESYTRAFWLRASDGGTGPSSDFGFGGPCERHMILGNIVNGGHMGLFLANPSANASSIKQIDFASNMLNDVYRPVYTLLTLADFSDISVIGNTITGPWDVAARLAAITRPRFKNNIIRSERNAGCAGVSFLSSADPVLVGNEFHGITGDAAQHGSATGTLTIYGNTKDSSVLSYLNSSSGYTTIRSGDNPPQRVAPARTVTANHNLTDDDEVILVDTATAAAAVSIFSSTAMRTRGKRITIKDSGGSASTKNITFNGNGVNVDGAATAVISTNWGSLTVQFDGTRWLTI